MPKDASVDDYLLDERAQLTAQPTLGVVIPRAQARPGGVSRAEIVRVIREARDDPGRL